MRHGESLANQQGLIVSLAENGISAYGLSETGRVQINKSVTTHPRISGVTQIISSDFKRAHESAQIAHALLSCQTEITLSEKLRERDFGDFELKSNIHYQTVWDNDAIDSSHTIDNAESADAVMLRATSLILSLEKDFSAETILLVSHGDTLQILQTAFLKQAASEQRQMPHLETAEIRELVLIS